MYLTTYKELLENEGKEVTFEYCGVIEKGRLVKRNTNIEVETNGKDIFIKSGWDCFDWLYNSGIQKIRVVQDDELAVVPNDFVIDNDNCYRKVLSVDNGVVILSEWFNREFDDDHEGFRRVYRSASYTYFEMRQNGYKIYTPEEKEDTTEKQVDRQINRSRQIKKITIDQIKDMFMRNVFRKNSYELESLDRSYTRHIFYFQDIFDNEIRINLNNKEIQNAFSCEEFEIVEGGSDV